MQEILQYVQGDMGDELLTHREAPELPGLKKPGRLGFACVHVDGRRLYRYDEHVGIMESGTEKILLGGFV